MSVHVVLAQQNKLMKGFSNQLIEKHRFVKHLEESGRSEEDVKKAKHDFDRLISFEQFLNIAGLELSIATVSWYLLLLFQHDCYNSKNSVIIIII